MVRKCLDAKATGSVGDRKPHLYIRCLTMVADASKRLPIKGKQIALFRQNIVLLLEEET